MYLFNGNNWFYFLFNLILYIMKSATIPLLLSLLAGLSTILGCVFIFIKTKKVGEFITLSLSISLGIMIFISIFDLIPMSLPIIIKKYGLYFGIIISFLTFILGYLFIYILEKQIKQNNSNLYKIGIISMISMIMHNFPEGIAVFMSAYTNIKLGLKMCIAIMLHNIPEGIIISVPLYYSGESRGSVIKKTLFSGLSEPIGALLSYLFLNRVINELLLSYILLFVSGLMISLSINNILKELLKNNNIKYIILGIIISIVFALFIII